MKTKICSKCKLELPVSEFYKNKTGTDGLHSACKQCEKEYDKSIAGRYVQYKHGAKRRNITFELSKDEFHSIVSHNCFFCGMPHANMGVDRLDNSKGYLPDNCVPCCKYCNIMKRERSTLEFVKHCRRVTNNVLS